LDARHQSANPSAVQRLCILICLSLGHAPALSSAQSAPAEAASRRLGFRNTQSEHFIVLSDAPPDRVGELLNIAESTYASVKAFARRLQWPTATGAAKLMVFFFNEWGDYVGAARASGFAVSQAVPGFFDEATNRCYMFNFENADFIVQKRRELAVARAEIPPAKSTSHRSDAAVRLHHDARLTRIRTIQRQLDQSLDLLNTTVVRHEIAHQVLFHFAIPSRECRDRRWLKEGLAMQFETPAPPNRHRLADFAAIDRRRAHLSAEALISDPTLIGPGAGEAQHAYAAAYALVFYLIDAHPTQFAAYLRTPPVRPNSRPTEIRAFEAAFGKLTPEFETRWRDFARQQAR
jgi:hypothetical protein